VSLQDAAAMLGRRISKSNWHTLAEREAALLVLLMIVDPAVAELVAHEDPDIDRVVTMLAERCEAGEIGTVYRSAAGGADDLDRSYWRLPHWRNYFITGMVDVDLPWIFTFSGGGTFTAYERCTREIFVRRSDVERFIATLKPADHEPAEAPAPVARPPKQAPFEAHKKHQRDSKASTGLWASRQQDEEWARANNYAARHVRDIRSRRSYQQQCSARGRPARSRRCASDQSCRYHGTDMAKSEPVKRADAAYDAGSAFMSGVSPAAVATATAAPNPTPDLFDDLAKLRLSQAFAGTGGVKKLRRTVPVHRPHPQDFFRVNPDPAFRENFPIIELKEEREEYLVAPALVPELSRRFIRSPRRRGRVSSAEW
jgi:hypothetical protein